MSKKNSSPDSETHPVVQITDKTNLVGHALREAFQKCAEEPVPDRLKQLIDKLRAEEEAKDKAKE